MINANEAYFLGLIYSKGDIIVTGNNKIKFRINIKYRRPNDEALRSDNVYTKNVGHEGGKERLASRFSNDLYSICSMLLNELGINFSIMFDTGREINWKKKVISINSDEIEADDTKFTDIFCTNNINQLTLQRFPFALNIEKDRNLSMAFVQGVCDACSLVPNEASSQHGGKGSPRIQLEPNQDRWELCLGLCLIFQDGLNIRVNNINWGHPQIRGENSWIGQNHQFRVSLSDIPQYVQLYRLTYKKEEYDNLYIRNNVANTTTISLCPEKKKGIKEGLIIYLSKSQLDILNSELLHENIRGVNLEGLKGKRSIAICYLLGCKKCREFVNIYVDGKLVK